MHCTFFDSIAIEQHDQHQSPSWLVYDLSISNEAHSTYYRIPVVVLALTHETCGCASEDTVASSTSASVGFAVWTNGTTVDGKVVYTPATIEFSVTPASAGQCWDVIDMYAATAAQPRVCASAKAVVTVDIPVNGTATGPIYLMPAPAQSSTSVDTTLP